MKMTCVIVDDEYLAIKIVQEYSSQTGALEVQSAFTRPQEALTYLLEHPVDLLFLDIQMPQLNGFELLSKLTTPPLIIFTTARHDYAVKAFDLDVLDYLVKPISLERFEKAVIKAKAFLEYKKTKTTAGPETDYLMIKADYRIHQIPLPEIEYIEGLSEYVKIHTSGKTYIPLAALKELADQLPSERFVRIHKSYIVSVAQIASFNYQHVLLKRGQSLPIGRAYKAAFLKSMEEK